MLDVGLSRWSVSFLFRGIIVKRVNNRIPLVKEGKKVKNFHIDVQKSVLKNLYQPKP